MPKTFLPTLHSPATLPTGQAMPPQAAEFIVLWLASLGVRGALMTLDDRLTQAAQKHASWLPTRTPEQMLRSGHIGRNGSTPNERVRAEGYTLPSHFPIAANQVESYARDDGGPQAALDALIASPAHHDHMLTINWYSGHTRYGVGVAQNYFVILTCPPEPSA